MKKPRDQIIEMKNINSRRRLYRVSESVSEEETRVKDKQPTPKLILLICAIQIGLYYLKKPHQETLYLQFDPTKRYEVWRYLTPFLVQDGSDVPYDLDLWLSILFQIWFGWPVEKVFRWKLTPILILSCVFSSSLNASTLKPCEFSDRSSANVVSGLFMANIAGHMMFPSEKRGSFRWKTAYFLLFYIFPCEWFILPWLEPYISSKLPKYFIRHFDSAANYGGAVGGFLVAVTLFNSFLSPSSITCCRKILKISCIAVMTVYLVISVPMNICYAYKFGVGINVDSDVNYEETVRSECNILWNGRM